MPTLFSQQPMHSFALSKQRDGSNFYHRLTSQLEPSQEIHENFIDIVRVPKVEETHGTMENIGQKLLIFDLLLQLSQRRVIVVKLFFIGIEGCPSS